MTNKYFVTGATGAIGSALLPLLLAEPDSSIWVLIRADSPEQLTNRLEKLIAFWELDPPQAQDARNRIMALQGDTDQNRFALPDGIYSEITRQCTHIIHCAGVVRMNLPLDTARRHAIDAAKNIVDLAITCQKSGALQKVEFVSTVGVAGKMSGLVPETWITQPREFHNTYEQSKAEAEDFLREQIDRHQLPVTVHRPSMVVGDSKTGKIIHYQIFYHICEFLSGRRTFGLLPILGDAKLDIIPVDYVAECIKLSSQREDFSGKIFHLCSGPNDSFKIKEIQKTTREMMRLMGIRLPAIVSLPTSLFNTIMLVTNPLLDDKMRKAAKAFPFFLAYLNDQSLFDQTVSARYLKRNIYRKSLTVVIARYLQSIFR